MALIRDGEFRVDKLVLSIRDGSVSTILEEFDGVCDVKESADRAAGFTASEDTKEAIEHASQK